MGPIAVVLEARRSAHKQHWKSADAEVVVTPEIHPETVFRYPVAVVASALSPSAVIVIPRMGARLSETGTHLTVVLRDAAVVDASMSRAVDLNATVIGAPVGRLRPGWTRGPTLLLMLLPCGLLVCIAPDVAALAETCPVRVPGRRHSFREEARTEFLC